jgi:hypothetical protein
MWYSIEANADWIPMCKGVGEQYCWSLPFVVGVSNRPWYGMLGNACRDDKPKMACGRTCQRRWSVKVARLVLTVAVLPTMLIPVWMAGPAAAQAPYMYLPTPTYDPAVGKFLCIVTSGSYETPSQEPIYAFISSNASNLEWGSSTRTSAAIGTPANPAISVPPPTDCTPASSFNTVESGCLTTHADCALL